MRVTRASLVVHSVLVAAALGGLHARAAAASDAAPAPEVDTMARAKQQPFGPLVAEYRQGKCRLAVEAGRSSSAFNVTIDGLEPGETYTLEQRSGDEGGSQLHVANADGHHEFLLLPQVLGQSEGVATVFVRSAQCVMIVIIPWTDRY